ncbi:MAG: hypothetical protein CMK07_11940 [Ponticaulis sp.]|nr:hypothetical protein [Ponticaulis sp.]
MLSTARSDSIVEFQPSYKPLDDEYSSASQHALMSATRRELARNGWRDFDLGNVMADTKSGITVLDKKWGSTAELVVDSVLDIIENPTVEPTLPLTEQLCRLVDPIADMGRVSSGANLLRGLLTASTDQDAAGAMFRAFLNQTFRRPLKQILAEAAAAKKIRRTYDVDLAMEILFGTLWHRVLVMRAPLSEAAITRAVTATLDHLKA